MTTHETLRRALEPFAKAADAIPSEVPDDYNARQLPTVGQLRAARAALTEIDNALAAPSGWRPSDTALYWKRHAQDANFPVGERLMFWESAYNCVVNQLAEFAPSPAGAEGTPQPCGTCGGSGRLLNMIPCFNAGSMYEKPGGYVPCPDCKHTPTP